MRSMRSVRTSWLVLMVLIAPCAARAGPTLIISELQFNPKSPESEEEQTEWVELHNYGRSDLSLRGMQLSSGTSARPAVPKQKAELPDVTVPAGGYVIIAIGTRESYAGLGLPEAAAYLGEVKYAWFSNGGDSVMLRTGDEGELIDQVVYQAESPWPEVDAGMSIQFVAPKPGPGAPALDPAAANDDPQHWVASTAANADSFEGHGSGTPGAAPKLSIAAP